MRVSFRTKNLEMTAPLRTYIESKIVRTANRLLAGAERELPVLEIEIERDTRHHRKGKIYRAEANLSVGKQVFRASVEDEDIRTAIDLVSEELESELVRFKSRKAALFRRGARSIKKSIRLDPAARKYRKGRIRNEGN